MKVNYPIYYLLAWLFLIAISFLYQPPAIGETIEGTAIEDLVPAEEVLPEPQAQEEHKRAMEVRLNTPEGLETLYTLQENVGDFLAERYFSPQNSLLIRPPLEAPIYNGIEITLVPYEVILEKIEEKIPYEVVYKEDNTLEEGKRLVLQEGRVGINELTYSVYYAGEKEFYREPKKEAILTEALEAVVAMGTKPRSMPVIASREKTEQRFEEGVASWYGAKFHGNRTTSGEIYNKNELTAAHPSLPFDTLARVTYLRTGKDVVVRINDRGPHIRGRIIDLSRAAAEEIGLRPYGIGRVQVEVLGKAE